MELSTISNDTMNITCTNDQESVIKGLSKQIEELKQEIHETKKQLQRNKRIQDELEVEVERLETQNQLLVSRFEDEKTELINTWSNRVGNIQATLEEERAQFVLLSTENEELLKKYRELQKQSAQVQVDHSVLEEIKLSKVEIKDLKEEIIEKKENICSLECEQIQNKEKINDLQKQLKESQESLKCKSESLQATLLALEEMKDEKALLSSEIAILKAGPVEDKGRGNSLFSELEDKRVVLENKLKQWHQKYLEAKRQLVVKSQELENLKRENVQFRMKFAKDEKTLLSRENKIIASYKTRLEELNQRIKELELRPESPQIITFSEKNGANFEWIHIVVEKARAEARDLKQALDNRSMETIFHEEKMFELESEVIMLNREILRLNATISELEYKLSNSESKVNENSSISESESKVPRKTISFAVDVKENDGVPLKKGSLKKKESNPLSEVSTNNTPSS